MADGVFHKAKHRRRRLLIGTVPHEQFLEAAGMEAHQQFDGLPG